MSRKITSKRALIVSDEGDLHTRAVRWALRQMGCDVSIWDVSCVPSKQCLSYSFDAEDATISISGAGRDLCLTKFDSIWLRRPRGGPPHPSTSASDETFAVRETQAAVQGALHVLSQADSFWVNSIEARARANSKPTQLLAAKRAGLAIPRTLISNDPKEIRRFHSRCGGDIIYKPFFPAEWQSDETGFYKTYTTRLKSEQLEDDLLLALAPGCYQEEITKRFEVRVIAFGERLLAARIDSQSMTGYELDYRTDFANVLPIQPQALPSEVQAGIRNVMKTLGIQFGCFDILVSSGGAWIFLEVNEMGQFLWLERRCSELKLLHAMAAFLARERGDSGSDEISLVAFTQSSEYREFVPTEPEILDFTYLDR